MEVDCCWCVLVWNWVVVCYGVDIFVIYLFVDFVVVDDLFFYVVVKFDGIVDVWMFDFLRIIKV